MKVYTDPTANLFRNPVPTSTNTFSSYSPGVSAPLSIVTGTNALGGDRFIRTTFGNGTTTANNIGLITRSNAVPVSKTGDVVTFSAYIRSSFDITVCFTVDGRESLVAANTGWSFTQVIQNTALVAGEWTRVQCKATVNNVNDHLAPAHVGFALSTPSSGQVFTSGSTIDISNILYQKVDVLNDYFDGNYADCSWAAGANTSFSFKNGNMSFVDKTPYVSDEAYNEVYNPRFTGAGAIADLWAEHNVNGCTGSLAFISGGQKITATSIPTGGQYGIYAVTPDGDPFIPLQKPIASGTRVCYGSRAVREGTHASTRATTRLEFYAADKTTLVGTGTYTPSAGTGQAYLASRVITTAEAHYVRHYIYLASPSAFTGTSSFAVYDAWVVNYFGNEVSDQLGSGFFHGNSGNGSLRTGCAWMGATDASKSVCVITYAREGKTHAYNGTNWTP